MLKKMYYLFYRLASPAGERGEYSGGYWQRRVRQEALRLLDDLDKGRVIEVGCGEGFFLGQLAAKNTRLEIWGVDNNAGRLKKAGERCRDKKVDLSLQDASALSFDDGFFDAVVCINVFFNMDSIKSVERALKEIRRVCKKSGRIIFDIRNSMNPLFAVKYKFARYYDSTVKNLPLNAYNPKQIDGILNNLGMEAVRKRYVGFSVRRFAPIIIIEAKKRC